MHPYGPQEFCESELYRSLKSDAAHFRRILEGRKGETLKTEWNLHVEVDFTLFSEFHPYPTESGSQSEL